MLVQYHTRDEKVAEDAAAWTAAIPTSEVALEDAIVVCTPVRKDIVEDVSIVGARRLVTKVMLLDVVTVKSRYQCWKSATVLVVAEKAVILSTLPANETVVPVVMAEVGIDSGTIKSTTRLAGLT